MTGLVRSLYNADAAAAIHEMIFRRLGLNLDPAFFTTNIDRAAGTVTLQALAQSADGTRSPYSGSVTYPLSKLVVERQIPPTLTWSGAFPPTVDELADYLLLTHDFYLEDGDFYGNGDRDAVPLTRGMTFTGALDPIYQTFQLVATDGSPRWAVNSVLTFQKVESLSLVPLDGMAVTNNAPDGGLDQAYSFSYSVENGVAPYSFAVVEGSTPAPLDSSGTMTTDALADPGTFDWTVKTTDADGRVLYVQDSAQVAVVPLAMGSNITAQSVQVGDPIAIPLNTTGGKKPYTYDTTLPATLSIVDDQLVGGLDGALAHGTASLAVNGTVTVTDALGSQVTRSFQFTVNDRADSDVQAAIRAKVVHWYEMTEPSAVSYTDNVAADTFLGIRYDRVLDTLNRSNLVVTGISNSMWNDSSVGSPWTQYFAYVQNFSYNAGRLGFAQAATPEPIELFSENLSVWAILKRQGGVGVQHVLGFDPAEGGWALKVDQDTGELVMAASLDGVPQERRFGPVGTGEWGSHFLQLTGDTLEWCHNTNAPVYATPFSGTLTPNLTDPLTLAVAPSKDLSTHYSGLVGIVAYFNDRLWSDERKWLNDYTPGSAYFQPQLFQYLGYFPSPTVGAVNAVTGLTTTNSRDFNAVVGEYFAMEWTLSGGNGYYFNPGLFNTPAGLTQEIYNGNILRLSGTATAAMARQSFYPTLHCGDRPDAFGFITQYSLTINDALTVTGSFADTTLGAAYDQSLSVSGGTHTRMVTLVAGALPAGLSLYGAGQYLTDAVPRLTGTPTAPGTASFTLRVQTNDGQTVDTAYTLYVEDPAAAVNLVGTSVTSSNGVAVTSLSCSIPSGAVVGNLLVLAILRGVDPLSSIPPGWVLQLSTPQGDGSAGSQVLDIYIHSNYDNYGSYNFNVPNPVPLSAAMLALSSQTGVTVENSATETLSHDGSATTGLAALTPAALGYVMSVVASELVVSGAATTFAVDGDWQALTSAGGSKQQLFAVGKKLKSLAPLSGMVTTNLPTGLDNAWDKVSMAFASTPVVAVNGTAPDAYYGVDYTATFNLLGGQGAFHYFGFTGTTLGWGIPQVSGSDVLFKGLPDSRTSISATLKVYCDDGQIVMVPVSFNVLDNGVAWDAVYPQTIYAVTYSNRARRVDQTDNNEMQTWATKGLNMGEADGGYFEVQIAGMNASQGICVGVANRQSQVSYPGNDAYSWAWRAAGGTYAHNNVSSSLGSSFQLGDVVGVACRQGKLWFALNGSWLNGGDPASGSNPVATDVAAVIYPMVALSYKNVDAAEGHFATGEFIHAPPSGFVAWNDLPALKPTALTTAIVGDQPAAAWTLDNLMRPGQSFSKMPVVDLIDASRAIYPSSPGNTVWLGQNGLLESGHAMLFSGGGYLFHTSATYNTLLSALNGDTAFSLVALVQPSQVDVLQTLLHLGNTALAGTQGIQLQLTATGAIQVLLYDTLAGQAKTFTTADGVVAANITYLIGVTRAVGGAVVIYLNGVVDSNGTLAGSVGLASAPQYTGAAVTAGATLGGSSYTNTFHGVIETLALYEGVLTADQMTAYGRAAGMVNPTTWDSGALGPNATLSTDELTFSADAAGWSGAFATTGHQTGKWQYEVTVANGIYSAVNAWVGVQDKTNEAAILQAPIGSQVYGFGIRTNTGDTYRDGLGGSIPYTFADGDVVGFAADLDAGTLEVYKNGTLVYTANLTTGKTYYPAVTSASQTALTLAAGTLAYPVSGFATW